MITKLKSSGIREVNGEVLRIPNMVDGINMVNLTAHDMMYDLTHAFCLHAHVKSLHAVLWLTDGKASLYVSHYL